MAYSVDDIKAVEAWLSSGLYDSDDVSLDMDVTTVMTDGTNNQDADEWKEGLTNGRVEISVPPGVVTALKVRFYFNSVMSAGDNALLPYTDANSVSTTNEVIMDYTTAGQWIEHITDASFIAELGDLGGYFAVRLSSSSENAKSKIGEVNVDVTYTSATLSGVTKDKDGSALGSCEVALFRIVSAGPPTTYEYVAATTSDGSGNYSFTSPDVWSGYSYMAYSIKDDSPHVFDATDNVLVVDT